MINSGNVNDVINVIQQIVYGTPLGSWIFELPLPQFRIGFFRIVGVQLLQLFTTSRPFQRSGGIEGIHVIGIEVHHHHTTILLCQRQHIIGNISRVIRNAPC